MLFRSDPDGNSLRGWGGPGPGYEWPASEHNIHIDYKGYVWLSGDSCKGRTSPVDDDQLLKFTQDGAFVMQVGRSDAGTGDNDTENFRRPPNVQVSPKTNEVFISDGYRNRRVIVFDINGKYLRHWGAYGRRPDDTEKYTYPVNPATSRDPDFYPSNHRDPAAYRLMLDRMGLTAEGTVFIDDQPVNLAGAEEVGLTPVRLDPTDPAPGFRLARTLLGLPQE